MRLLFFILGFFLTLLCLHPAMASQKNHVWPVNAPVATTGSVKEWTIMVYMSTDNNLEGSGLMDLLEMEQGLPENVEVIALVDRHKQYAKVLGDWTGTRLYRLRKGQYVNLDQVVLGKAPLPADFASELLQDCGELDMANPETLANFISFVGQRFPAKRYALIPWDHGGCWQMLLQDEDGGNGRPGKGVMSIAEFVQAVQKGAKNLPRGRFDLIKFDMCLMAQLDVMAEVAKVADYAVASPPVALSSCSDNNVVMPLFNAQNSTEDLARKIVDSNIAYYTKLQRVQGSSAFKLSFMPEVTRDLQALAVKLKGIATTSHKELTRVTGFVTHYGMDFMDELKGKQNATSSIDLFDWLERIEREVPNAPVAEIATLRNSLNRLVYHHGSTVTREFKGVSLSVPLRREYENPRYRQTTFARESGMADYLSALYNAQDMLGNKQPVVSNIQLGAPKIIAGRSGSSASDFELQAIDHLTPFSHNVVRFDVSGDGILLTRMMQFEQRGQDRYLHCDQLVLDLTGHEQSGVGGKHSGDSLFTTLSPVYKDGTTTLMREISSKYKVSNGQTLADITIEHLSSSRDILLNQSVAYGLYADQTTGGRELPVKVTFSNVTRMVANAIAFLVDGNGQIVGMNGIEFRPGGIFRPSVTVVDGMGNSRKLYGAPMQLGAQGLILTTDMVDNGTMVGAIIIAEGMNGKRGVAIGPTLPVRHNQAQMAMLENAKTNGAEQLVGRYAMVQLATSGSDVDALPIFQTVEFAPGNAQHPDSRWILREGSTVRDSGALEFLPFGIPQVVMFSTNPANNTSFSIMDTWYAFLRGSGPSRTWYCIGEGTGTRWALIPIEQYQPSLLEGVWTSKTERWEFRGNTVTLSRDGKTGSGQFTLEDNILKASNMPFPEYAVYLNREQGRLSLMSREKRVSILRSETVATGQPVQKQQTTPQQQGQVVKPQDLVGTWQGTAPQAKAWLRIQPVAGTQYYNLRYKQEGQQMLACTFAVSGQKLLATFQDGWQESISFGLNGNRLQLKSMRLMIQDFVRQ